MNINNIKYDIIQVGKLLHEKNFVAANDGNLSVKIGDKILVTPTCTSKGFLTFEDIVEVDLNGKLIKGKKKPTSEIQLHLTIYKLRDDINAVCHAHPIYATSFAVSGKSLNKKILPEVIISLDEIPLVKYATPGSINLSKNIKPFLNKYDAFLLQNHGALTLGTDIWNAYFKMESLEHFAKIYFLASQLGKIKELPKKEIKELIKQRDKFGVRKNLGK